MINIKEKKSLISIAIVGIFASHTLAFAGFQTIENRAEPSSNGSNTEGRVIEGRDNGRQCAELNRISAELAALKIELAIARNDLRSTKEQLDSAQSKIDNLIVNFSKGSSTFKPTPAIISQLVKSANLARQVEVDGFTDSTGSTEVNKRIALQRALTAKQFLMERGIAEAKIKASGRTGQYVASNTTDAGRAANRRVEFEFSK